MLSFGNSPTIFGQDCSFMLLPLTSFFTMPSLSVFYDNVTVVYARLVFVLTKGGVDSVR